MYIIDTDTMLRPSATVCVASKSVRNAEECIKDGFVKDDIGFATL